MQALLIGASLRLLLQAWQPAGPALPLYKHCREHHHYNATVPRCPMLLPVCPAAAATAATFGPTTGCHCLPAIVTVPATA